MKIRENIGNFLKVASLSLAFAAVGSVNATELQKFQAFNGVDHASFGAGGSRETDEARITVTGISGTVQKAYLYWHGHGSSGELEDTLLPFEADLNGQTVAGTRIGVSGPNGWSFFPYQYYFGAAFRADVTSLVTGNGTYVLNNFNMLFEGVQGASLIVIYNDGNPDNNRDVTIYDGCDQNSSNPFDSDGWNVFLTGVSYAAGDSATLEFHVSDGQMVYDETPLFLNQTSFATGNIFTGSAPHNPNSGYRVEFFTGSLWDVKTFDIAPYLPVGVTDVSVTTGYADDHITVVATVLSLKSNGGVTPPPPPPNLYPPTITCPPSATITTDSSSALHTTSVTVADRDGDTLSVVWRVNGVQVRQDSVAGTPPLTQATLALTGSYGIGTHSVSVTVQDGRGGVQTCTTFITVQSSTPPPPPPNLPPVAVNDSKSTFSGVPVSISVLANDSDPENDPISITTHTQPSHGSVTLGANGVFTYTPPATFIGTVTFTYTITDGRGTSTATVTITVSGAPPPPVNQPPVAVDDNASTLSGVPVTIPVLGNDSDPENNPISVTTFTQPATGTVSLGSNGLFTYTPPASFVGVVTFTYTITDGNSTATATVTIIVTGVNPPDNLPPVAVDDSAATISGLPVAISALANDSDPENDALAVTTFTQPSTGSVTLGAGGVFTYTPPANFVGTVTFTYTITDGGGTSTATVTVVVNSDISNPTSPDPCALYPIALHIGNVANIAPGTVLTDVKNGVQPGQFGWLTWAGSPNEPTLVTSLTPPGDSETYINPDDSSDHTINIGDWVEGTPGIKNSSSVRYSLDVLKTMDIIIPVWDDVRRNGNQSDYRVVNFAKIRILDYHLPNRNINTITARFLGFVECGSTTPPPPVNNPPVASNDSATTAFNTPVTVPVLGNDSDADGDTLTVVSFTQPANGGVVSSAGSGSFTLIPSAGFSGVATFTYTISDGEGTATATVTITVSPDTTVPPPGPCGECDGKVSNLTLRYNGSVTATIVVKQQDGSQRPVIFEGTVQPGQTFTIVGVDKQKTLGPNVSIQVNGAWSTDIHTSCSVPIGIGQVWGSFTITDGYSRNNGRLCPL